MYFYSSFSQNPKMKYIRTFILLIVVVTGFCSCDHTLDVNADWKDITVVYGLLDQSDSVHYLKITKAFLGEGNALSFAKIPDSSNYPGKLDVRIEGWELITQNDSTLRQTIHFDTVTINNKEEGDARFYFPYQIVYRSVEKDLLNSDYTYKLFIKNNVTGKEITAETPLVEKMPDITKPSSGGSASFIPGKKLQAEWISAKGGKRYQLVGRFYYRETKIADTTQHEIKTVDWIIFNDLKTVSTDGGDQMKYSYPADVFYSVLGSNIPVDPTVARVAMQMEYIFTVAADDLNTYMEVTEPSFTIVQEKPPYTNIANGIGIFSSRHNNSQDYPIIQTTFTQQTLNELKVNENTRLLGF
jgi:hypothetical protein